MAFLLFICFSIGGSLVQRLSTVLNQIKSLEFASDAEVNGERIVNDDNQEECDDKDSQGDNEPMAHDDDQVKCDEEKMEDEEVADDENGKRITDEIKIRSRNEQKSPYNSCGCQTFIIFILEICVSFIYLQMVDGKPY